MKPHTSILQYLLLPLFAVAIFSCANTEDLDGLSTSSEKLILKSSAVTNMPSSASNAVVKIEANCEWTVEGLPEWLSANPMRGEGDASITISALENSGATRSAEIMVKGNDRTLAFTVSQAVSDQIQLSLSTTTLDFGNNATTQSILLNSNRNWQATISYVDGDEGANWCSLNPTEGSANTTAQTVRVSVTDNYSLYERQALVTFNAGGQSITLTVTQQGTDKHLPVITSFNILRVTSTSFVFNIVFESNPPSSRICILRSETTAVPDFYDPNSMGGYLPETSIGGSYDISATGLTPGKSYYVRGYVTNSEGTAFTDVVIVTTPTTDQPVGEGIPGSNDNAVPATPVRQQIISLTNSR